MNGKLTTLQQCRGITELSPRIESNALVLCCSDML